MPIRNFTSLFGLGLVKPGLEPFKISVVPERLHSGGICMAEVTLTVAEEQVRIPIGAKCVPWRFVGRTPLAARTVTAGVRASAGKAIPCALRRAADTGDDLFEGDVNNHGRTDCDWSVVSAPRMRAEDPPCRTISRQWLMHNVGLLIDI